MKWVWLVILVFFLAQCTVPEPQGPAASPILEVEDGGHITLTATQGMREIQGVQIPTYAYNGMIPGPLIKAKQGSSFTVTFVNNIDMDSTIHWHGLRHDNKDDGVPDVTQPTVKPGESFDYTVTVPDQGMFWYHPHVREDKQQDLGMAGNLWVISEDAPVNHEEVLMLDDILIKNDQLVPYGKEYANFALMGRFGNVMLLNGQTDYTKTNIRKGEVLRFYVTNVANVRPFNLSFGGAKMKLVGSDLGFYEQQEFVDSIVIAPAERYIVDVFFEEARTYNIQNINPLKTYNLGKIIVESESHGDNHSEGFNVLESFEVTASLKEFMDQPIDYEINLTLDMTLMPPMEGMDHNMDDMDSMDDMMANGMDMDMGMDHNEPIEWEDDMGMMNSASTTETVTWILRDKESGNENMDFTMEAKVGDKLKLRFINDPDSMHPMQHPIHIHGQRFLILSIDDKPVENHVWKDTVLVPTGSTVDILVDVTNPGDWMMHCHISEHLEAGMMSLLRVTE